MLVIYLFRCLLSSHIHYFPVVWLFKPQLTVYNVLKVI